MTLDHSHWMKALQGNLAVAPCPHHVTVPVEGDKLGRRTRGGQCEGSLKPAQPDFQGHPNQRAPWPFYEAVCDVDPSHSLVWPHGRAQS